MISGWKIETKDTFFKQFLDHSETLNKGLL